MECDTMTAPLLLTPDEASAILGRDLSQLREDRKRNVGPDFHNLGGGLIRYRRESVLRDAERRAVRPRERSSERGEHRGRPSRSRGQ